MIENRLISLNDVCTHPCYVIKWHPIIKSVMVLLLLIINFRNTLKSSYSASNLPGNYTKQITSFPLSMRYLDVDWYHIRRVEFWRYKLFDVVSEKNTVSRFFPSAGCYYFDRSCSWAGYAAYLWGRGLLDQDQIYKLLFDSFFKVSKTKLVCMKLTTLDIRPRKFQALSQSPSYFLILSFFLAYL